MNSVVMQDAQGQCDLRPEAFDQGRVELVGQIRTLFPDTGGGPWFAKQLGRNRSRYIAATIFAQRRSRGWTMSHPDTVSGAGRSS